MTDWFWGKVEDVFMAVARDMTRRTWIVSLTLMVTLGLVTGLMAPPWLITIVMVVLLAGMCVSIGLAWRLMTGKTRGRE